jgi:hypothetical protein
MDLLVTIDLLTPHGSGTWGHGRGCFLRRQRERRPLESSLQQWYRCAVPVLQESPRDASLPQKFFSGSVLKIETVLVRLEIEGCER